MPRLSTIAACAALVAVTPQAAANEPAPASTPPGWTTDPDAVCPADTQRVLGIGSSTMGAPLGGMLAKAFAPTGVTFHRLAAASSGLARPDF